MNKALLLADLKESLKEGDITLAEYQLEVGRLEDHAKDKEETRITGIQDLQPGLQLRLSSRNIIEILHVSPVLNEAWYRWKDVTCHVTVNSLIGLPVVGVVK